MLSEPTILWILLVAAMYPFIQVFLIVPFKVRERQTKRIHPDFKTLDPRSLPADFAQMFAEAKNELNAVGFEVLAYYTQYVHSTGQEAFVLILVHPKRSDFAKVIGIATPTKIEKYRVTTLIAFQTRFTDQTSIVTSNTSSPSIFPGDPRSSGIRCPGVGNLELLYRLHRARVDRDQRSRIPTVADMADPIAAAIADYGDEYQRLIKAGYFMIDPSNEYYAPTYKGAFIMTWRLLPPLKQIRWNRQMNQTDRELRKLGFGGLEEFKRLSYSRGKSRHP